MSTFVPALAPVAGGVRPVRSAGPGLRVGPVRVELLFLGCGMVLLPWAVLLAALPGGLGWAVLDVVESAALSTAAVLLRQGRSPRAAAGLAAVLLVADAGCDVASALGGPELAVALLMAVCAELPLAALCCSVALGRSGPGAGGSPAAPARRSERQAGPASWRRLSRVCWSWGTYPISRVPLLGPSHRFVYSKRSRPVPGSTNCLNPLTIPDTSCRCQASSKSGEALRSRPTSAFHAGSAAWSAIEVRKRATTPALAAARSARFLANGVSVKIIHMMLRSSSGIVSKSPASQVYARLYARMSNRLLITTAGNGSSWSTMARIDPETVGHSATGVGSSAPASVNRCDRSLRSSSRALATASSTWADTWMSRPCSSHVYQVTPTAARPATSSRRNPGVRRRPTAGRPTCSGEMRSRRLRKNVASSRRRSSAGV
ncbi:hypothetical protein KCH_26760 [Kitasatospora cheerisanensis KCTC 2395]|uniref:Uncharacterized protein n=1 Tax=Kitasatospora cheerisanensis KCTC 2395 TaxID=1348663 RepID=A0A066Z5J3_9ACTN|nr:hypothetical protein KCH_26760 [Kitasatospora cheerisanensis KCTC 2395]